MEDEKKILGIINLFTMAKWENYEDSNFSFDMNCFFSKDKVDKTNINYQINKWEMISQRRVQLGLNIIWSKCSNKINDIKLENESATVSVKEEYSVLTDEDSENISRTIYEMNYTFVKENDCWVISDIKSNDDFDKLYFNEEIKVDEWLENLNKSVNLKPTLADKNSTGYLKEQANLLLEEQMKNEKGSWYSTSFSRSTGASYAATYWNGNNSGFYEYSANCQNFASQCIWKAFGGSNYYIETRDVPMMYQTYDSRDWYQCDGNYECDGSYRWVNCDNFANYLDSTGYKSGPRGWYCSDGVFNYCAVSDMVQLEYSSQNGSYQHTYIVNATNGTWGSQTRSNIWVTAHTTDRYNCNLGTHADLSGIVDSRLRILRIVGCRYYE